MNCGNKTSARNVSERIKTYNTIGCCGIDCGLCPRFHTKGNSACPGCGGPDFKEKHPSCGFLTCCLNKKGLEVCASCPEYPCKRFEPERYGRDSFVTHRKIFPNLEFIWDNGLSCFIDQQKIRMEILNDFLLNYDEGRSKSFFCTACALLPLNKLIEIQNYIKTTGSSFSAEENNKLLKERLQAVADNLGITLKLNNKK